MEGWFEGVSYDTHAMERMQKFPLNELVLTSSDFDTPDGRLAAYLPSLIRPPDGDIDCRKV